MTNEEFLKLNSDEQLTYLKDYIVDKYKKRVIISDSPIVSLKTGGPLPEDMVHLCTFNIIELDQPDGRQPYNSKDFNSHKEFHEYFHEYLRENRSSGRFEIEQVYPPGYDSIRLHSFRSLGEFFNNISDTECRTVVLYTFELNNLLLDSFSVSKDYSKIGIKFLTI